MKVLVIGASGATGRLVVDQLLDRGVEVAAIVRSLNALPDRPHLQKIQASVHELTSAEMAEHIRGCAGVVSCLGHNLSFKGLFGKPRLLVTETITRIAEAIQLIQSGGVVKIVLMNTTGNSNRGIPEMPPLSQRIVVGILRVLLPPHLDNEKAADYLRVTVGQQHDAIEWVAVRPDALVNEDAVTQYTLHESPTRNAIFNSGKTSRINVAHFMAALILEDGLWREWRGRMPVIYNR